MNFKTKIYITVLYIFFSLNWLKLNWYTLKHPVNTIVRLLDLTGSGAGFNSVMSHGTMYALLFLLFLNDHLISSKEQHLVRMERKGFLNNIFKTITKVSLVFNFIFISTGTVLTVIFADFGLLVRTNYFIGVLLSFMINSVFYVFVGSIFCTVYIISFSKTKALICSFLLMVILSVMCLIYKVWTPVNELFVYDLLFDNRLSALDVVLKLIKIAILIGFIRYIVLCIFKEKDVIENEAI